MSTSTVGFVTIEDKDKDFFKITSVISDTIKENYSIAEPQITVHPNMQYVEIQFAIKDFNFKNLPIYKMPTIEKRTLSLNFDCNNDHSDISARDKIIWSVNNWGMSQKIIHTICKAMVGFGNVYFIPQDTNEYNYEFVT